MVLIAKLTMRKLKRLNFDEMPRGWWLFPWLTATHLQTNARVLANYVRKANNIIDLQAEVIDEQSKELEKMRQRILFLTDAITAGTAIVPDAKPVPEEYKK